LCVMIEVRQDVREQLNGEHRDAMEKVIKHLHLPPCPNQHPEVLQMTEAQIVDVFWDEFKAFQKLLGCRLLSNYLVITVITVFWVSDFGYCLFLRRVTIKIGESNQKVRRK